MGDNISEAYAPPGGGGNLSGTGSGAAAQGLSNPRRKPQGQSVSLKSNPSFSPPTLQHAPLNAELVASLPLHQQHQLQQRGYHNRLDVAAPDIPRSGQDPKDPHPMASVDTEHSSGGDSQFRSNPDDWYASWNSKVKENNQTAFNDDDPPYYLGGKVKKKKPIANPKFSNPNLPYNEPSVGIGAVAPYDLGYDFGPSGSLPLTANQNLPPPPNADDSLSDSGSFRSVIDDLTIKNQKLKKRLKKLERLHCKDEGTDKLFEVRVHGLTLEKKRELHDLLQRFASTLHKDPNESTPSSGYINSSLGASPFTKSSMNPPSSLPQTNPTDSAYASNESSRIGSTPSNAILPRRAPVTGRVPLGSSSKPTAQHSNEKAKMKTVVKRLEHLFTGKEALRSALSPFPPSQAQQDIANIAAQDDRNAKMNAGELVEEEGPREAQLMTWQQDKDMADAERTNKSQSGNNSGDDAGASGDNIYQRPTRPLDLDPQRSQVPAETVVYLEHITSSLPNDNTNFLPENREKASSWVYLNLITNLAQLHTLNVTVPFIKRAIQLYSNKLELSTDGRKIRWKGGSEGTKLSSDGSMSNSGEHSNSDESSPDDGGARVGSNPTANSSGVTLSSVTSSDKLKNSGMASSSVNGVLSADNATSFSSNNNSPPKSPRQVMLERFKYKPMLGTFATHRGYEDGTESDSASSEDSLLAPEPSPGPPRILDANTSPQPIENLKKLAPIDGPVIYFGGSFCIDLSSQIVFSDGANQSHSQYYRHSEDPIGPERPPSQCSSVDRTQSVLFNGSASAMALDIDGDDMEMILAPLDPPTEHSEDMHPKELEVSGLGGVRPDDNFMLYVRTSHCRDAASKVKVRHFIPQSSLEVFFQDLDKADSPPSGGSPHHVLSIENRILEPSKMPSPFYGIFSSSEESEAPNTSSSERIVSDSDMSYNFPIDLDSRSEADDDAGGWTSSGNNSKMDLDKEEGQRAVSTVATAGGSVNNEDQSPLLLGEVNPKSSLLKPMDLLSIDRDMSMGLLLDSPRSSSANPTRMPLKRAHDSSQDINQPGVGITEKPPAKIERIE